MSGLRQESNLKIDAPAGRHMNTEIPTNKNTQIASRGSSLRVIAMTPKVMPTPDAQPVIPNVVGAKKRRVVMPKASSVRHAKKPSLKALSNRK